LKQKIDARGLACPQPVVLTKNKMKECGYIEILVDNETACENIKRLAASSGWTFSDSKSNDSFLIILKSDESQISEIDDKISFQGISDKTIVVFSSDKMGKGDDELGATLMKAFVHTLSSLEPAPSKIVFYNSGIKLAITGSGVIDDLQVMQEKGVELLICGTCANYFNAGDKIQVGIISNMFDILNTMNSATRTINP